MYPIETDYSRNIGSSKFSSFILDPKLKGGKAEKESNGIFPKKYPGGYACVFKINKGDNSYALRCWTGEQDNLKTRYYEISKYLQTVNLPYFIDFEYIEKGIIVNGGKYPITRMNWVEGNNIRNYIAKNIATPQKLSKLANKFSKMVKDLHINNISHGDLQSENIIIEKNGNIKLIDYDSLYVPNLSNERDTIKGIPSFQHPARNDVKKLTPKVDYFSELVIYLSILVFSIRPKYWDEVKDYEKELIFRDSDYYNYKNAVIFKDLKKLSSPMISAYVDVLFEYCQANSIDNFQPLEEIIENIEGNKFKLDNDSKNQNAYNSNEISNVFWKKIGMPQEGEKVSKDEKEDFNWEAKSKSKTLTKNTEEVKITEDLQKNNLWNKIDSLKNNAKESNLNNSDNDNIISNNTWEKLKKKEMNNENVWERLYKSPKDKIQDVISDNIIKENTNIWNNLKNTATNIWTRLINIFNS